MKAAIILRTDVGPNQTFFMGLFRENNEEILAVNYFHKKIYHRCLIGP